MLGIKKTAPLLSQPHSAKEEPSTDTIPKGRTDRLGIKAYAEQLNCTRWNQAQSWEGLEFCYGVSIFLEDGQRVNNIYFS